MMVATRFGSSCEAAAHFEMESAQCWISILKMGEMLVEVTGGKFAFTGDRVGFVFQAKEARSALINMTASGTIVKPDKQPLPSSCGVAAVCRYIFAGRARGMRYFSILGHLLKDPARMICIKLGTAHRTGVRRKYRVKERHPRKDVRRRSGYCFQWRVQCRRRGDK